MYFLQNEAKELHKKKNKAKKLRKLLMKDWKMMKMMLAMKMKTLDNSNERDVIKTVFSICNRLYKDQVHEERKLANMQYFRRIYLPSRCAKKYWFWTRFLLPKLHPVKWTCNQQICTMLQCCSLKYKVMHHATVLLIYIYIILIEVAIWKI